MSAVLMTLVAAALLEMGLRRVGYEPSLRDSPELWALHRADVYPRSPGEKVLVLVGGSRIQLDVSPSVLSHALPGYRIVQLAIDGSNPLPVFYDLARDPAFAGSVIMSFRVPYLLDDSGRAAEYVTYYHQNRDNLNAELNARAKAEGESRLAFRGGQFILPLFLQELLTRREIPRPPYIRMLPDRSMEADYTRLDIQEHREERVARAEAGVEAWRERGIPMDALSQRFTGFNKAVAEVKARGGEVALVRFPVGETLWRLQEEIWPRSRFWDELAVSMDAVTLHFKDEPTLDALPLPDESHLDYRDAPAFTRALLEALTERGFLEETGENGS